MDKIKQHKTRSEDDLISLAIDIVDCAILIAKELIASDPAEKFLYKQPNEAINNQISYIPSDTDTNQRNQTIQKFVAIGAATNSAMLSVIKNYIATWKLSQHTKYVLLSKQKQIIVPNLGTTHKFVAVFSKPSIKCPNPLATAMVYFYVHKSYLLPLYYTVMITYKFEGYRTHYYALGRRSLNSITFQKFYIDSILHSKLIFFVELGECRYPATANEKSELYNYEEHVNEACKKRKAEICEIDWLTPNPLVTIPSYHHMDY